MAKITQATRGLDDKEHPHQPNTNKRCCMRKQQNVHASRAVVILSKFFLYIPTEFLRNLGCQTKKCQKNVSNQLYQMVTC